MRLESQVISLDLAKRLKELGVKQETLLYWENTVGQPDQTVWKVISREHCNFKDQWLDYYSAFTVAELGEIASQWFQGNDFITTKCEEGEWGIEIQQMIDNELKPVVFYADTEADARAKMLIYLLENKLISPALVS